MTVDVDLDSVLRGKLLSAFWMGVGSENKSLATKHYVCSFLLGPHTFVNADVP
jgi:hypothetical protein